MNTYRELRDLSLLSGLSGLLAASLCGSRIHINVSYFLNFLNLTLGTWMLDLNDCFRGGESRVLVSVIVSIASPSRWLVRRRKPKPTLKLAMIFQLNTILSLPQAKLIVQCINKYTLPDVLIILLCHGYGYWKQLQFISEQNQIKIHMLFHISKSVNLFLIHSNTLHLISWYISLKSQILNN